MITALASSAFQFVCVYLLLSYFLLDYFADLMMLTELVDSRFVQHPFYKQTSPFFAMVHFEKVKFHLSFIKMAREITIGFKSLAKKGDVCFPKERKFF